jgi:carboxylesterase type B
MKLLSSISLTLLSILSVINAAAPQVDLGYSIYAGTYDPDTEINTFWGIRYASAPIGNLRWQAPQPPPLNRSQVLNATSKPIWCPQSPYSTNGVSPTNPADGTWSEDCLFLNVFAPANATKLPVLVWIHGGGYGGGYSGAYPMANPIYANANGFIGVTIQYRLGAFGFLASDEVARKGLVNAGLYDQQFSLQWVQQYIHLFGGDPDDVTIAGDSAGAGSVMLHAMGYGGTQGSKLFKNIMTASPYLPTQYGYKDWKSSQAYYAFAYQAGCFDGRNYGNSSQTIFECLVSKDLASLINASQNVSASGEYGTWAFTPVTDGDMVQELPSQQLLNKQVNGVHALIGNNADEGPLFVSQTITTEDGLVAWLKLTFPLFTSEDIAQVLMHYPSSNASDNPNAVLYATDGDSGATAVNQSDAATGQQQRANNIYAETTFVCPSYWLAEAFSGDGRSSYKYQYSVPVALHGSDEQAYFNVSEPNHGPDFNLAFMKLFGQFIITGNPSIPDVIANGAASGANATAYNPASNWPPFSVENPYQIDLNQTGGTPTTVEALTGINATELIEPGLKNDIRLVNAYTWEGGRGYRCDFWRSIASVVPE